MRSTFKALAVAAATLATLTTGVGVASASPIRAAGAPGDSASAADSCGEYDLCLFPNSSFGGTPWVANFFDEPSGWNPVGSSINNATSSIENLRDNITWVAQYADGKGHSACLPGPFSISNLAGVDWPGYTTPMNDSITSYKFDTSGTCPPGSVP